MSYLSTVIASRHLTFNIRKAWVYFLSDIMACKGFWNKLKKDKYNIISVPYEI